MGYGFILESDVTPNVLIEVVPDGGTLFTIANCWFSIVLNAAPAVTAKGGGARNCQYPIFYLGLTRLAVKDGSSVYKEQFQNRLLVPVEKDPAWHFRLKRE
jgi:hypothetical protein